MILTFYVRMLASFVAEQSQKNHEALETNFAKSNQAMIGMQHDHQANASLVRENNSILTRLTSLVTG